MDFKSVFSYVGVILEILGILVLLPVIVSWIFNEGMHILFFVTAIISFVSGTILDKKLRKEELTLSSAMVIAAMSFILVSIIGAIPYLSYLAPLDAVFESVSGFTTTGLTVVTPENLPYSLLFWRSFTQWIGGIGILFIFLLLVRSPGISSCYLYKVEARVEKIEAGVYSSVKKIFTIYIFYTMIGIVLLMLAGMPVFDSVLNSFSSLSTGGFTPKTNSIGAYQNPWIETVIIFLMVLGATSFFVHDKLLRRKIISYIKNPETRLFWFLILLFSVLLSVSFLSSTPGFAAVRNGIFHTFSALTTTGFTVFGSSPEGMSVFMLIILMVIGGYAGSTAGGLKLVRSGVILKSISWLGKKISLPQEAVVPFKFGNKVVKDSELTIISFFVCIYILILCASTIILTCLGYSPINSFFEAASAQGTVGLSVISLNTMPWIGKLVLMMNMLLGRLEIFPFLVLLYTLYKIRFERKYYLL
jgi:trk system potassium uptake protein TrkH